MASKRRQRRAQCGKKQKLTSDQATRRAIALQRKHVGERFDAYPCPYGDHYHVGHRTKQNQQRIQARREQKKKEE